MSVVTLCVGTIWDLKLAVQSILELGRIRLSSASMTFLVSRTWLFNHRMYHAKQRDRDRNLIPQFFFIPVTVASLKAEMLTDNDIPGLVEDLKATLNSG